MTEHADYIIDIDVLNKALSSKGIKSYTELARSLGLHRNTIGKYVAGDPALPNALELIMSKLSLSPGELLKKNTFHISIPAVKIASLIEELQCDSRNVCYILFGSRARGKSKPFSDYDIGIFSNEKINFKTYSKLLNITETWNQNNLLSVDLTNLANADLEFLANIVGDAKFLAGSFQQWINFIKKSGAKIDE